MSNITWFHIMGNLQKPIMIKKQHQFMRSVNQVNYCQGQGIVKAKKKVFVPWKKIRIKTSGLSVFSLPSLAYKMLYHIYYTSIIYLYNFFCSKSMQADYIILKKMIILNECLTVIYLWIIQILPILQSLKYKLRNLYH